MRNHGRTTNTSDDGFRRIEVITGAGRLTQVVSRGRLRDPRPGRGAWRHEAEGAMARGNRLVNMRLDAETKELLRRLAEAEKRSMTAEIVLLVRERAKELKLLPAGAGALPP